MGIWDNLQTGTYNTDRTAGNPYAAQKMLKVLY